MSRLNTDSLGFSELKWMVMGKFKSDDHYIYYCGQESLRRNGVALIVSKGVQSTWVQPQKQQNDLGSFPFNIRVIQDCVPTTDAEEAEVDWFSEDLHHLIELTPK